MSEVDDRSCCVGSILSQKQDFSPNQTHSKQENNQRKEMELTFEKIESLKYRIRFETTTPVVELEMTYEQLREIQETIKPFNPTAASHFPVYQLWLPFHVNLSPTLDLQRFQQVSALFSFVPLLTIHQWGAEIFSPRNYSKYPEDIKDWLSKAFGVEIEQVVLDDEPPTEEGNEQQEEKGGGSKHRRVLLKVAKKIATEVVIPALLGLAEEIPVIGRISRLLSKCGSALQEFSDQDPLVEDLRTEISKVKEALQTYEEVFQRNDEEELMRTLPLNELEASLEKALESLTRLAGQGMILGVLFAHRDNDRLQNRTAELKESLQLFHQSIPLYLRLLDDRRKMQKLLCYPEVFRDTIRGHLSQFQAGSRQWLFDEIFEWLNVEGGAGDGMEMKNNAAEIQSREAEKKRVFWIRAEPGMGKSAFAATLSKRMKAENGLLGAYFCRYTEASESSSKIIRSLSAQCCENLCSATSTSSASVTTKKVFEEVFLKWNEFPESEKPSSSDLFDLLLTGPLQEYSNLMSSRSQVPHHHPPMIFLIDALDEVSMTERQPLLHILSSKIQSLPSWVKIVITSRPEADIVSSLRRLKPLEIKEDDARHLEDIQLFVRCKLEGVMDEDELEAAVELFVARSEGRFIYVSSMLADLLKNESARWSLSDLDARLPEGLVGWYREFFVRMRARDQKYFDEVIFPVVGVIIGSKELLSLEDVKLILKLDLSLPQQQRLVNELRQLFPLRMGKFVPFHKSASDWLTDEALSGSYLDGQVRDDFYVSKEKRNKPFVDYFASLFVSAWLDEGTLSRRPASGSYFYRHAFDHFLDSSSEELVLFGLTQLFRLRLLASLLEEIGVHELVRILERYLSSISSRFQDKRQDISELKLLLQLVRLSSPGLKSTDIDALPFQLLARLTPSQCDAPFLRLQQLSKECHEWRSVSGDNGFWLKPIRNCLAAAGGSLKRIIKLDKVSLSQCICLPFSL